MMTRFGALKGGMPLYKFVGNRILTRTQNLLLGTSLTEFHSGYRVYSVAALQKIRLPAELERLPLRHRDHHPADQRRPADRGAADPDLLRRRDLPRERDEVRERRRAGDPAERRPPGGPSLPAALRSGQRTGQRALRPEARLREQPPVRARRDPAGRLGDRHRRRTGRHRERAREEGLPGGGRRSVRPDTRPRTPTSSSSRRTWTRSRRSTSAATTTCCCST